MPPKPRFTKQDFINAALDIIRESNIESVTAQAVAKKLDTSTRPMFNYFDTLEELRNAAAKCAREMYNARAERGLAMTPAFKGFAMEYVKFAMDEPSLFRLLFMQKAENSDMKSVLDSEGHLDRVIDAVTETFNIDSGRAMWLYENLWLYAHGMATLCASEVVKFSREELAEKFGVLCRSLLMCINAPEDERTRIVPQSNIKIKGSVEDYIKRE